MKGVAPPLLLQFVLSIIDVNFNGGRYTTEIARMFAPNPDEIGIHILEPTQFAASFNLGRLLSAENKFRQRPRRAGRLPRSPRAFGGRCCFVAPVGNFHDVEQPTGRNAAMTAHVQRSFADQNRFCRTKILRLYTSRAVVLPLPAAKSVFNILSGFLISIGVGEQMAVNIIGQRSNLAAGGTPFAAAKLEAVYQFAVDAP